MNFLDISNADRLRRYPSGKCPLCGGDDFTAYLTVDEGEVVEHGLECTGCTEQYRIEQPIAWIDHESIYRQ
ncbi:hypothetical protein ACKFKH_32365 [Phormidesmis sp. 146-20]